MFYLVFSDSAFSATMDSIVVQFLRLFVDCVIRLVVLMVLTAFRIVHCIILYKGVNSEICSEKMVFELY